MGINKDRDFSAKKSMIATMEDEKYKEYSEHDKALHDALIEEVNNNGYYIQYEFQLSWLDKEDFLIVDDIIMKYSVQFERKKTRYGLIHYLGKRGNFYATDFLLEQFNKPNDYAIGTEWNTSRRGVCSSALESIRDKSRVDEYIKTINNADTRDDSFFFILLLGELRVEKAIPLFVEILSDDNSDYELKSYAIKALSYFKKKMDIKPIVEPFLCSEYEVLRERARRALK